MIVSFFLGFYYMVCIGVLLFNFRHVFSSHLTRARLILHKEHYLALFRYLSEQEQAEAPEAEIVHSLCSPLHLIAFQLAADAFEAADAAAAAAVRPALARYLQKSCRYYVNRPAAVQACYSLSVTRFQVMEYAPSEAVTAFLLKQIREGPRCCNVENSLRALCSAGQVPLMLAAFAELNKAYCAPLSEAALVDSLLTFAQPDALIAPLWELFSGYRIELQRSLLAYICAASGSWGAQILALLAAADDSALQISCVRYLGRYPDERFLPALYHLAEESETTAEEVAAACADVLAAYPCEETLRRLKHMLYSQSWPVRSSAAASLQKLCPAREELQDILTGADCAAKALLQYHLGIAPETEAAKEMATT